MKYRERRNAGAGTLAGTMSVGLVLTLLGKVGVIHITMEGDRLTKEGAGKEDG